MDLKEYRIKFYVSIIFLWDEGKKYKLEIVSKQQTPVQKYEASMEVLKTAVHKPAARSTVNHIHAKPKKSGILQEK